ncbi:MAG TPA: YbaB/EbfC family nucleoid-associated protein [Fimbriimonadaceae bacterium]|nr:YbaB/EbfC family nucleoid-associated protein [Fimbriimonadaceae bacterium]
MKLPKQFGGQGFQAALQKAQSAMARAKTLEKELASETIEVDKGPVKATFDGTGLIKSIKIDKEAVDPDDLEMLEDLLVSAVRDGFTQATELRESKLAEIMPDLPPGMQF